MAISGLKKLFPDEEIAGSAEICIYCNWNESATRIIYVAYLERGISFDVVYSTAYAGAALFSLCMSTARGLLATVEP